MKRFTKPYQLWTCSDYGYHPQEFDTLEECLGAAKYTDDWYVTRRVEFEIKETER